MFDTVLETHDHGSFNSWGRDRYWRSDRETTQAAVDEDPALPFLDAVKTTVIRDSRWRCDHGWDIDLDDGSSHYDIYNNLMLNGGLKFREGFRRRAWNNVTVNNGFHPHVWFANSGDEFFSNIVMTDVKGIRAPTRTATGKFIDKNLFFVTDPNLRDKYSEQGWDGNSIVADPLFVDPANGDFRVRDGSPAFTVGFTNFPMNQFGVKKPALASIARTPDIPALERSEVRRERTRPPNVIPQNDVYWLGARLLALEGEAFSAFGVRREDGGVVLSAVPDHSAAAGVGLRVNDLVQGINGRSVSNLDRFLEALARAGAAPLTLKIVREQSASERTIVPPWYIDVETASAADGFRRLPPPESTMGVVTARPQTQNDRIESLTDGELDDGYGPIFANGVWNGVYKMDLGRSRSISAITSWSFYQNPFRGIQKLTLYGSNTPIDPGWDLSGFTALGSVDSSAVPGTGYTAGSLRAVPGRVLGEFRWIVWAVSPVSSAGGGENTAFQELAVEFAE